MSMQEMRPAEKNNELSKEVSGGDKSIYPKFFDNMKLGTKTDDTADNKKSVEPVKGIENTKQESENIKNTNDVHNRGLTEEEKVKVKNETGWSDEIINSIGSWEEYMIYKNAGLKEAEIGGRKCLIRSDIDGEQKDVMGNTNNERIDMGLSPINKDGKVIELHHIGQRADSPLAELTPEEHRGKGNDTILHDKKKESEIDRQAFNKERIDHWKARANEGGGL